MYVFIYLSFSSFTIFYNTASILSFSPTTHSHSKSKFIRDSKIFGNLFCFLN